MAAAGGAAVWVLAPNGRRVTVKVSPGTALLQVLEEICSKQNFSPDDYDLKFQRTVLDLSLQWRFANLPNNAKLEMVPATRLRAGPGNTVRIALQVEDGSRLQEEFLSGQTLWELLHYFPHTRACLEGLSRESSPVCVYMRDEVTGEAALKRTTLKSLGLTRGSGIIRFVVQKYSPVSHSDPSEHQPATSGPRAQCDPSGPQPPTSGSSAQSDPSEQQPATSSPSSQSDPSGPQSSTIGPYSQSDPSRPSSSSRGPLPQSDIVGPWPATSGPSVVKTEQDTSQAIVAQAPQSTSDPPPLPRRHQDGDPSQSKAPAVKAEQSTRAKLAEEGRPSHLQEAVPHTCSSPPPPFVPFLGGGQRLGGAAGESRPSVKEEPLSVNLPTALSSPGGPSKAKKSKTLPEEEGGFQPVEREAVVCHLDLEDPVRREWLESCPEDLPDNFFDVTVDDVRKRLAQLKSDRQRLAEMPLMTKALREAQKKEKLERYPKVVLRVLFPDRYILQGFFHPEETVQALRDFVKSHLEDVTVPFYLFVTPPRVLLNDESETFFQANLFPAAVVHFGSEAGKSHYLQQQLLDAIVSPSLADLLVARSMPRSPVTAQPPRAEAAYAEEAAPGAPTDHTEAAAEGRALHTAQSNPGKVPKWLKLPGKK